MTPNEGSSSPPENPNREAVVESLFRHARVRERPPAEDEAAIRDHVHDAWLQMTRRRRRAHWLALGTAASVLLAVALLFVSNRPEFVPTALAEAEQVIGKIYLETTSTNSGTDVLQVRAGQELLSGTTIRTSGQSFLALRWRSGFDLRMNEQTEIVLKSPTRVRLLRGTLFLDSRPMSAGAEPVFVETPLGLVTPVGTRYMTRVSATTTEVSVRSGTVRFIAHDDAAKTSGLARTGQRLIASRTAPVRVESVPTWGPHWSWSDRLAPAFDADGRSLAAFFDWVADETGRSVRYVSFRAQRAAANTLLHGTIEMEPLRALTVAAATSDLQVTVVGEELRVDVSQF